jgi:ketosteroid isomerase-like protein
VGSEANAALIRRAYDAWNRNDWDELGEIYDGEVVAVTPEGFVEPGEFRGWPALRQRYRELKSAWEDESIDPEEIVGEGDWVTARVRWYGLGKSSGAPISLEVTNLVEIRDGKIARLEYFWDFDEAVAAMHDRSTTQGASAPEPG